MNQLALINAAVQSTDPFPVDFDQLWQWAGFSSKGNAKTLLNSRMKEGRDFEVLLLPKKKQSEGRGGHNAQSIRLTLDAAKAFCLLAQTDKGDEMRAAFIAAEKELRAVKQNPMAALPREMAALVTALMESQHAGYLATQVLKMLKKPLGEYGSKNKSGVARTGFRNWCLVAGKSRNSETRAICDAVQQWFEFASTVGLIQFKKGGE